MKGKLKDILIVINGKELVLLDLLLDFGWEYGFSESGETLLDIVENYMNNFDRVNDVREIKIKIKKKRGK